MERKRKKKCSNTQSRNFHKLIINYNYGNIMPCHELYELGVLSRSFFRRSLFNNLVVEGYAIYLLCKEIKC